ncbi:hypothetical protein L9F63_000826, partial [Diploptera punctata]
NRPVLTILKILKITSFDMEVNPWSHIIDSLHKLKFFISTGIKLLSYIRQVDMATDSSFCRPVQDTISMMQMVGELDLTQE